MIRFLIFLIIFSVLFGYLVRWLYLVFKAGNDRLNYTYEKIHDNLETAKQSSFEKPPTTKKVSKKRGVKK